MFDVVAENHFGDVGAVALASALAMLRKPLVRLALDGAFTALLTTHDECTGNAIGDTGATALAQWLHGNRSLQTLALDRMLSHRSRLLNSHRHAYW